MRQIRCVLLLLAHLILVATLSAQITLVKSTNGQHAAAPPGPVVVIGSTVTWTYVITSGARDLTNVALSDNQIGAVACPATTLAAGTSMTCTATGTATAGQYTNTGTVNAMEVGGGPVSATDVSYYFGEPAGLITLVKSTNGQDANTPPGPVIAVGAAVNWTYVVTNTSGQTLTAVTVDDDQGVIVSCPQATLIAGESMTCTASGIAQAGQYSNIGTAHATHPTFGSIVASDPSHYFGQSQDFDYGDAPDTYGTTLAANGARHLLGSNVFLGACVDSELDGQPSAGANGDSNVGAPSFGVCATPGNDEDGVTFNGPLNAGGTGSITVVANAPCTLSAWIDFNQNGNFLDVTDNIFLGGTTLAAGSNTLSFTIPSAAIPGATYGRFRCTTDGAVGPLGSAHDGEVEDYQVTIATSADVSVTKGDAPDPVTPGTNLTYTIVVNNAGPSDAANVSLSDTLPANTTFVSLTAPAGWICSTPAMGAAGTINCSKPSLAPTSDTLSLVVAVSPAASGTITNTVSVASTTADPTPGNNSGSASTLVGPPHADLSVTKSDAPDPVTPGGNLTYTLIVNNAGPSNAATVSLNDALPANTTFVSLTPAAGWNCNTPAVGANGAVSCSIATLAAGISATFTLTVAVSTSAIGTINNTATITSTAIDSTPGNNSGTSSTVVGPPQADVSVTKSDAPDPVAPGGNLTYTLIVHNAGPSNATTVSLTDTLPANTTFVSLAAAAGWTCMSPAAGSSGTVSCSIATLAPGNSATFTLTVAVSMSATGTISNTATVSSATDSTPGNNSSTAITTVGPAQADLSVTKSAVAASLNVTYTIAVGNGGPSNATTATLTDPLPAGTTFVSMTSPAGWSCMTPAAGAPGTVTCTIATLPPGSSTFTLVIAVSSGAGVSVSNTATVSSATADPNPANNTATATTANANLVPALSPALLLALAFSLALLGALSLRRL